MISTGAFQFRYPQKQLTKVYFPKPTACKRHTYYSTLFKDKPVLLFFNDEAQAKNASISTEIDNIHIDEAKYIGQLINMPLVIILNSQCSLETKREEYDIYYLQVYKECM